MILVEPLHLNEVQFLLAVKSGEFVVKMMFSLLHVAALKDESAEWFLAMWKQLEGKR